MLALVFVYSKTLKRGIFLVAFALVVIWTIITTIIIVMAVIIHLTVFL